MKKQDILLVLIKLLQRFYALFIYLNNSVDFNIINLEGVHFYENDPETVIHVRPTVILQKAKHLKIY